MRLPLSAAVGVLLVLDSVPLRAQEPAAHGEKPKTAQAEPTAAHGEAAKAAKPEPVKVAPPIPTVVGARNPAVQVTPSVPTAKVAAAVAEALRAAEAAEARRAERVAIRPILPRRTPAATATAPAKRYEVRWPEQRMVVQWPAPASDRIVLIWPGTS